MKRLLKDTSIRLTMTRQVSMLKPSVLMSLPVEEEKEAEAEQQEGEQLSRNNKASLLPYLRLETILLRIVWSSTAEMCMS